MQVIRVQDFGGPEALRLDELPTPQPGPGQVLVKVAAAGVNFIDIYHRSGAYKNPLPLAIGQEGAGTVEVLGEGVGELRVGDRVAWTGIQGSYATHVLAPAARLVPVPAGVSLEQAAAVLTQGITAHYLALSTYPLQAGDTCLVHAAAGGMGNLLCQIARMRGARVIGTVGSDAKVAAAREAGATEVIVYTRQEFEAEVKRLTDGEGLPVVYDSVGKDTFERSLNCLRPRGYMVLCGQASGAVPPLDPQVLNAKGSLYLTRPSIGHYISTRQELLERAGDVLGWVAQGTLKVHIHASYPLAEAAKAHAALASRQTIGKLALLP